MSIFVSLLGLQPAATVTVVRTLHARNGALPAPLGGVVLLASKAVRDAGLVDRVKKALSGLSLRLDVRDLDAATESHPLRHMPSVVGDMVNDAEQGVVVHVDPGPQHLVTALVAALGPATTLVTTDIRHVIVTAEGQPPRQVRMEDIGLSALLELHGLPWTASGNLSQSWNAVVGAGVRPASAGACLGFTFDLPEANRVVFDIAYERCGHLFLLRAISGGGTAAVRATAAIRPHLCGLRPVIGIVSDSSRTVGQARAQGLNGLHMPQRGAGSGAQGIRRWIEATAVTPGATMVMRTEAEQLNPAPMQGGGGTGPGLVCWLGDDASATLVCIASHCPSRLWLLVDHTSAPVVERARRLRHAVGMLPCGGVQVVESDTFGTNLQAGLTASPEFAQAQKDALVANLSPGRKVQGLALARVPSIRLCTIDNRSGHVAWLDGDPTPALSLTGPPILAAATVCGGPLKSDGSQVLRDDPWGLLGRALHDLGQEGKNHVPSPVVLLARRGRQFGLNDGRVLKVAQQGGQWFLSLLDSKGQVLAHVSLGADLRDGRWFECLVAVLFANAGADEVRRNVEWAWLRKDGASGYIDIDRDWPYPRVEVDVVARFGTRFVVVSCKAGRFRPEDEEAAPDRPPTVDEALREVEAVAAMGFGRFALPALAVPKATAALMKRFRLHQGAAALDLSILHDPDLLRSWVNAVAEQRAPH